MLHLWNPLDLGPFLCPISVTTTLNSSPDYIRVGDINPHKTGIDKLIGVLHEYIFQPMDF